MASTNSCIKQRGVSSRFRMWLQVDDAQQAYETLEELLISPRHLRFATRSRTTYTTKPNKRGK